uniref:hypothetical protein n=1 Tax=Saccharolobus islandicus TaxID=43080 RepID=UPI0018681FB4|nr:hypothetical protein [Sulfolobus islandicus]
MRKKFAYTETLSSTGGKNISLPGIGEISEGKMIVAMMIIILGFIIKASLQVHIAAFLTGIVILAIPETSVGFDKTLAGAINYYFRKSESKEKKNTKNTENKIKQSTRTITPLIRQVNSFFKANVQLLAGTVLVIVGIELFNINPSTYFVYFIVFIVVGLGLVLSDYILKITSKK